MHFDDLPRRRWWLLTKGLETHPLKDALLLAHAAEAFLLRGDVEPALPATVSVDAPPLLDGAGSDREALERDGDDRAPEEAASANVVVTTIDQVIVYLRRQDDVVVPQKNGLFLVNARSLENPDQLLTRANRIRKRHRLPVFMLLPAALRPGTGSGSLATFSAAFAAPMAALLGC